ncbi:fatty acid desaturase [Myxococcota bacterium]|nr:fatty acid desaturase [Myxococcota bacterium]
MEADSRYPTGIVIDKSSLVDDCGIRYRDFRRSLTPRLGIVWRDLLGGYAVLIATVLGLCWLDGRFPRSFFVIVALGSPLIGYGVAFVNLFLHEAAHYNIARRREWNDRLSNLWVGMLIGQEIKAYRIVHFEHHRKLGQVDDTERNYFDSLGIAFVLESLTGLKAIRGFWLYRQTRAQKIVTSQKSGSEFLSKSRLQLILAIALHFSILCLLMAVGHWPVSLAWALGVLSWYPFWVSVRQCLEHRSQEAERGVDYRKVAHGPYNRLFGDGPLASTLGGAGFNRHLLHHLDPQVPYPRLAELENYLMDTEAAAELDRHRTTYADALRRLWSH